jgi:hypothetical protein
MVPAWTLVLTLVAGLLVGAGIGRLTRKPADRSEPPDLSAPVEEPTASEAEEAPAAEAVATKPDEVEAVVAELERRVRSRKVDTPPDSAAKGRTPKDARDQS